MNHYNPEKHIYTSIRGRLPGATDVIKSHGLINVDWMSEDARWRGQCVHRGVELFNRGELDLDTVDEGIRGYIRSYESFVKATGYQVLGCEIPCFTDSFGTIPDTWGILNGVLSIVELKSGLIPKWAAIQTALQVRALREDKNIRVRKRFALRLMEDGSISKLIEYPSYNDDRVAMGMVETFHWKKENGYFKYE